MALFKAVKKPVIRQAASDGSTTSALRPRYSPKTAPCAAACPIGCDVRGAMSALAEGQSLESAWRILTARNPFPVMTGRLCDGPCEAQCHRVAKDGAVSIRAVELSLGEYAIAQDLQFPRPKQLSARVAILGGGYAALSAAYHLARRGYGCTVFGAPDAADPEIRRILCLGVELRPGAPDASFDATIDAVEDASPARAVAWGLSEAESSDARLRGVTFQKPAPRPPVPLDRIKLSWYPAAAPAPGDTVAEARRCMSCGMCMACGNCWMYCSHSGFEKLPNGRRYRLTLDACNGCKKCADECPSGYIDMV